MPSDATARLGERTIESFVDSLRFDHRGLIPAVSVCVKTQIVLMQAWMNREALERTLKTKQVTYFSRSRGKLWRKGETSGNEQRLVEMRVDCDRDCLLLLVEQQGHACHTGKTSCFYRSVKDSVKDGGSLTEIS